MKLAIIYTVLSLPFIAAQCSDDVKISSQADIGSIASCSKFGASITVEGSTATTLDFSGITQITGDISFINNFNLNSLSLNDLKTVGGTLQLLNNTQIIGLSIPKLSSVKSLELVNNPALRTLSTTNISSINNLQITQTSLSTHGTITAKTIDNIELISNSFLKVIDFSSLITANGYINIVDNQGATANFQRLTSIAGNSTFRQLSALNTSAITSLSNTFNVFGNTFTSFSLESLNQVSMDLTIANNTKLTNFRIPLLSYVDGGIQIVNNPVLTDITNDTFPALNYVKGGVNLSGPFNSISFPNLTRVDGALSVTASGNFTCDDFQTQFSDLVEGQFTCEDEKPAATTDTKSNGSPTILKSNVLGGFVMIALVGLSLF
ncbi:hypothetical protein BB559_006001 [Furculomyces boomerangus]|uniref:Receptor L-domain domain-containing protein n=1 Tax=Furculomyces boomerangus TaxID=61424 RepID=A0A2T9XYW1_9FUNG|nr:hypothetical protein BB559_007103 [Furculomyces boomerangus]PVU87507.1 hypothetical protein BB559_006001 [Furculomyces boomerangus]